MAVHAQHLYTSTVPDFGARLDPPSPLFDAHQDGSLRQLLQAAGKTRAGTAIHIPGAVPDTIRVSYEQLFAHAQHNAHLIHQIPGLENHRIILLHFDNHYENIEWFWAVVFSGFLPAISTPFSNDAHQREQHLKHLNKLLENPVVLTTERLVEHFPELKNLSLHTVEALQSSTNGMTDHLPFSFQRRNNSTEVLMLTSGSTGNAKAVSLTSPQIFSSISGKSHSWSTKPSSVFLNWIGLDHVANLTEIHLHAMFLGAEQVHVQANDLLADPILFLRLIDKHRVTHTFAPNFFLALLEKQLSMSNPLDMVFSLDLSCLRSVMSGGEANVVSTANSLTRRLNARGVVGQVIRLGYGLTESCAALTYGMIDPEYEERERHEFASIGKPIPGAFVRISTDNGTIAKAYEIGSLELSGSVLFKEYFNDPASTAKAFTKDGWFITGDRAYIDSSGKLNMAGRIKEVIVINGIKYFPHDIENAIEKANIQKVIPSYTAAFAHRPKGSETEGYCIIYSPTADGDDYRSRIKSANLISKVASALIGTRPQWIVPIPMSRLSKSSLGKLSRSKIQAEFEKGFYDDIKIEASAAIREHSYADRQIPETETEKNIVQVLSEMLDLSKDEISVDSTIFDLGLTSIGLFRFEQSLRKCLNIPKGISIITFLSNPIIRSIANAIDNQQSRQYNPVVQLQARGTKCPLWLVHPASGNILAFLPLARTITDRPVFALTARGLSNNEMLFSSISEMADTYYAHLKSTQPTGPYALTGYSLGTTVAYELAKRLEAGGDTIAFCAALDSPPYVQPLVAPLDWTAAAVLVSYFVELIPQTQVPPLIAELRGLGPLETIMRLLEVARPAQREALNLDPQQLLAIVNVTDNFGTMAKKYEPKGAVNKVDVFFCTPLHSVERDRQAWVRDHLARWQEFSREKIEFHECDGDHADMLNPTYVEGFEQRLRKVLEMRGI